MIKDIVFLFLKCTYRLFCFCQAVNLCIQFFHVCFYLLFGFDSHVLGKFSIFQLKQCFNNEKEKTKSKKTKNKTKSKNEQIKNEDYAKNQSCKHVLRKSSCIDFVNYPIFNNDERSRFWQF